MQASARCVGPSALRPCQHQLLLLTVAVSPGVRIMVLTCIFPALGKPSVFFLCLSIICVLTSVNGLFRYFVFSGSLCLTHSRALCTCGPFSLPHSLGVASGAPDLGLRPDFSRWGRPGLLQSRRPNPTRAPHACTSFPLQVLGFEGPTWAPKPQLVLHGPGAAPETGVWPWPRCFSQPHHLSLHHGGLCSRAGDPAWGGSS